MRVLVDTCVVIDALQSRDPFDREAQEIFVLAAEGEIDVCFTAKAVTDVYYVCHRFTHSDTETRKVLGVLFQTFDIVDSTGQDCKRALSSEVSDYEDAVMVETARRVGADCVVTRNIKDFRKSGIKVLTPKEFLKSL